MLDTVTVTAPTTVPRWTCDLAGCGAQIVQAPGTSLAGWVQLTLGPLDAGATSTVQFDSLAHAQTWLAQQPVPVPAAPAGL